MESVVRVRVLGSVLVLSCAVVASAVTSVFVASRAYLRRGEQAHREARTLEVTGSATVRIESDLALWTVGVAGEGKTLQEAYERLNASADRVRAFLKAKAFAEDAVHLGPIQTTAHYARDAKGNETREVASYQLSRRFDVRTPDVRKVAHAAGEVTELLRSGAHVESVGPQYLFTHLADLKVRVQGEATANARLRAERIARESRCRLGAVREARAGVLQITRPFSTEVSGSGIYDTSTIDKDVGTTVRLTLTIEPEPR